MDDGTNLISGAPAEVTINNTIAGQDKAWTYRARSFARPGVKTVTVLVTDASGTSTVVQRIGVQDFDLHGHGPNSKKNIILYIGDAMGTAYRDVGRIVAKSTDDRFREGFFDELQAMDTMPVSGMCMTYNIERLVPDSSPTANAWATGNKTGDGTHGVFSDNDDFRFLAANVQGTKQYALNNPRVETLWETCADFMATKPGLSLPRT